MKTLMKESFVEITYDEANRIIIAKWIGFLKIDQVKKGCELISQFVKVNKLTKHLSNHQQLKVLSSDVQGYLVGQWFSEVEALGLTKIAVLVAEDVFAKATVDKVNQAVMGRMSIYTFGTEYSCYQWLNE